MVCVRVEHRATSNALRTQPPNHLVEEECIFICVSVVAEKEGREKKKKKIVFSLPSSHSVTAGEQGFHCVCGREGRPWSTEERRSSLHNHVKRNTCSSVDQLSG